FVIRFFADQKGVVDVALFLLTAAEAADLALDLDTEHLLAVSLEPVFAEVFGGVFDEIVVAIDADGLHRREEILDTRRRLGVRRRGRARSIAVEVGVAVGRLFIAPVPRAALL